MSKYNILFCKAFLGPVPSCVSNLSSLCLTFWSLFCQPSFCSVVFALIFDLEDFPLDLHKADYLGYFLLGKSPLTATFIETFSLPTQSIIVSP